MLNQVESAIDTLLHHGTDLVLLTSAIHNLIFTAAASDPYVADVVDLYFAQVKAVA